MTPQPGRHHTGIPQQAVPLQCCEEASRPLGLHCTRVDALADCRYCLPDVRGHSLGHIDTCGTHRVCLHATLSGGHLGSLTHDSTRPCLLLPVTPGLTQPGLQLRGTHRVGLHSPLEWGHLGSFTHDSHRPCLLLTVTPGLTQPGLQLRGTHRVGSATPQLSLSLYLSLTLPVT